MKKFDEELDRNIKKKERLLAWNVYHQEQNLKEYLWKMAGKSGPERKHHLCVMSQN